MSVMEELCSSARWYRPHKPFSRERILEEIRQLNMDATPGVPLCSQYGTVQDLITKLGADVVADMVENRIVVWRKLREKRLVDGLGSSELEFENLSDFFWRRKTLIEHDMHRVFIKREFHKKTKLMKGYFRLILSIGVIDQVIHALCFRASLEAEIENNAILPMAIGQSLVHGGAHTLMTYVLGRAGERRGDVSAESVLHCADFSHWDMTVTADEAAWDCEERKRLCPSYRSTDPEDEEFFDLFDDCYRSLFWNDIQISDGTVFRQDRPGMLRSGSKLTISANSKINMRLKILAKIAVNKTVNCTNFDLFTHNDRRHKTGGDDSIGSFADCSPEEFKRTAEASGHVLKFFLSGKPWEVDFYSHAYVKTRGLWVPVPVNWAKHRNMMKMKDKKTLQFLEQSLFCMCLEYAYNDLALNKVKVGDVLCTKDYFLDYHRLLLKHSKLMFRSRGWFQQLVSGFESSGSALKFLRGIDMHRWDDDIFVGAQLGSDLRFYVRESFGWDTPLPKGVARVPEQVGVEEKQVSLLL